MTDSSKPVTVARIQGKILELLEDASAGDEIDHAVCARYLDLLFKTLPELDRKTGGNEAPKPLGAQVAKEAWAEAQRALNAKQA